jgi:hypothetical protein
MLNFNDQSLVFYNVIKIYIVIYLAITFALIASNMFVFVNSNMLQILIFFKYEIRFSTKALIKYNLYTLLI